MPDRLKDRVVAAVGAQYDVEAEIGRGGSAVVYRATDVRLRRKVALKVLPPELAYREDVRARFLREAQTAAQLSHPNIVPIYAVDEIDGLVFFAMCLVEGDSVAARLRRDPRPPADFVRRVLRETADALAYAHARGVVHRDVKPDNILLDHDSGRAMVTDFGIARALEGADPRLTVTGIAVGTPAYMSPEQALGEKDVDARSDVYSLGVVGYLMLAGELPFRATNTPAMLMKHISDPPPPLDRHCPDAPADLRGAVERALRKDPAERWPGAAAMRDALTPSRAMPTAAPTAAPAAPAAPPAAPAAPPAVPTAAPSVAAPGPRPSAAPIRGPLADPPAAPPAMPAAAPPSDRRGDPFHGAPPPPAPAPSTGNSREVWRQQQRAWRERVRAQREAQDAARRLEPHAAAHARAHGLPPDAAHRPYEPVPPLRPLSPPMAPLPLEARFHAFRTKATSAGGLVAFLGFVNLVTVPFVPWAIFPAMGMWSKLRPHWRELEDEGVEWRDVWRGRLPAHLGGRDPRLARVEARQQRALAQVEAQSAVRQGRVLAQWRDPQTLAKRVARFRGAAFTALGSASVAALSVGIGAPLGIDELAVTFGLGSAATVGAGGYAAALGRRIRKAGLRLREMLGDDWRARLKQADPRPRPTQVEEEAHALVHGDVLAGTYGDAVRRAVADRLEVHDALARMPKEDRALLPDVTATVDALVQRVAGLAQALHRLDADHPKAMLATVDARIAAAEREQGGAADRERRLALLHRQRETLLDLVQRRDTLASQLESATLVLHSVRLDLLKLRSAGIGSALDDVNNATQEARALSRDIGHVLDAAREVRAL